MKREATTRSISRPCSLWCSHFTAASWAASCNLRVINLTKSKLLCLLQNTWLYPAPAADVNINNSNKNLTTVDRAKLHQLNRILCWNATCRHKPPGGTLAPICNVNKHVPNKVCKQSQWNLQTACMLKVRLQLAFSAEMYQAFCTPVQVWSLKDLWKQRFPTNLVGCFCLPYQLLRFSWLWGLTSSVLKRKNKWTFLSFSSALI